MYPYIKSPVPGIVPSSREDTNPVVAFLCLIHFELRQNNSLRIACRFLYTGSNIVRCPGAVLKLSHVLFFLYCCLYGPIMTTASVALWAYMALRCARSGNGWILRSLGFSMLVYYFLSILVDSGWRHIPRFYEIRNSID